MSKSKEVQWTRFDLTDGQERNVSTSEVMAACEDVGVQYDSALIAGWVRCGCFSYELIEEDEMEC